MTEIIVGDDFTLRMSGVRDPDGTYLNAATINYTLTITATGATVPSGTGSLTYVTGSSGNYRGVIESTVTSALTAGTQYRVRFAGSQGNYDFVESLDLVAKETPGGVITPEVWSQITGNTIADSDYPAVQRLAGAVNEALTRKCYPIAIEPKTLALFPCDAPTTPWLHLPLRPCRSISALYYHCDANGDSSVLDLTADLLTAGRDYQLVIDDPLTGWSRSGKVRRCNQSAWGARYRRPLGRLAYTPDAEPGAVFVSGAFGPLTVSPAVQEAASRALTLLWTRRTNGMPLNSESWAGYSYSGSSQFTAEGAVNSPEVLSLLMSAGVLPIHVG